MSETLDGAVGRLIEFGGWLSVTNASPPIGMRLERLAADAGEAGLSGTLSAGTVIDDDIIDALRLTGFLPVGPPPAEGQPGRGDAALVRATTGRSVFERTWSVPPDRAEDVAADVRAGFAAVIGATPTELAIEATWITEPVGTGAGSDRMADALVGPSQAVRAPAVAGEREAAPEWLQRSDSADSPGVTRQIVTIFAAIAGLAVVVVVAGVLIADLTIGLANREASDLPVASLTPSPSQTPSAAQGSQGSIEPADAERWGAFLAWVLGDFEVYSDAATTFLETPFGTEASLTAANELQRASDVQLAYLADHPPAPCYADIHATHVREIEHLKAAANAVVVEDYDLSLAEVDLSIDATNASVELFAISGAACGR